MPSNQALHTAMQSLIHHLFLWCTPRRALSLVCMLRGYVEPKVRQSSLHGQFAVVRSVALSGWFGLKLCFFGIPSSRCSSLVASCHAVLVKELQHVDKAAGSFTLVGGPVPFQSAVVS